MPTRTRRYEVRDQVEMGSLLLRGVEAASVGVTVSDPDGRFLFVNSAACALLGRSREELLRLTVFDITHPENRRELRRARAAMRRGVLDSYQRENRHRQPDGSCVWVLIRVMPIRDPDGHVEAFYTHVVDVTERKQRDERFASYISDAVWLGRIRDALDDDRLMLYQQPIVDLRSGETVQRELLLRMREENGEVLLPGDFLPVAERYGLIAEIDRWVIRQAARLAAGGMAVEFNLSAASIANPDVLREIESQLRPDEINPSLLVVEVTETAVLDQPQAMRALSERLSSLGCGLALDDFGTGFATLNRLKHMPAHYLKIDREFVRDISEDENDRRMVRGIVGLAREFGMRTIAEGVEDLESMVTLASLGVDCGQGFVFARPAPIVASPLAAIHPRSMCPLQPSAIAIVRAALDAYANLDADQARALSHPSVVVRPLATRRGSDPDGAYRGHEGLAAYFRALAEQPPDMTFRPTQLWQAGDAIIVSGQLVSARSKTLQVADAMGVYRFRDGLISSVQMFDQLDLDRAPITQNGR